ncbi:MAG TPA: ribosomal-processing cysteine protease Prp [Epulopiscium sp.]|nr:ribosomal-processing cysteine protease Prp [Candidatus Epulonipiscium sp.]
MIKINLHYNNQDALWCFVLEGHAGYADHGQDIVCAAVSMIAINTINSIDSFTQEPLLLDQDDKGGYIHCTFPDIKVNKGSVEATLLLKSMVLGLNSIQEQYGKYIQIITNKNSSGGE